MTEQEKPDPAVEGFLALSSARLAPRTVEAYRRDLAHLTDWLGRSPADASTDDLAAYVAQLRADGLAPTTVARRLAAVRSFFRHQVLLGARADNPAANVELPKRRRTLPRTLSPAEVERLLDAAAGTTPRALRDRALAELLYGAGLRVSEAVALDRQSVDLENRLVRCLRQGEQGARRPDRARGRGRRSAATSRAAVPTSTGATGRSCSSTPTAARSRARASSSSCAAWPTRPGSSPSASTRTSCATRSRRTCSREAPTCARSRRCSGMPIWRRRSSTRTYPIAGGASCISRRTRTPAV